MVSLYPTKCHKIFRPSQGRGSCGSCGPIQEQFLRHIQYKRSQRYLCLQQMATKTFQEIMEIFIMNEVLTLVQVTKEKC